MVEVVRNRETEPISRLAALDDGALVDRLLARDEAAFVALVERYHPSLVRLALTYVSSAAVAEEVAQETWVGVLKGLAAFERRSMLKTWIFRILTNRAKTRGVREGRTVPFSALGDNTDDEREPAVDPERFDVKGMWALPPSVSGGDPEALLERREAMTALQAAIDALPAAQRAVVILRDLEGVDAPEACNILEISETNQRVLLHRARSRLRRALEPYVQGP